MYNPRYQLTHQRCQPLKQIDRNAVIDEIGLSTLQKNQRQWDHGSLSLCKWLYSSIICNSLSFAGSGGAGAKTSSLSLGTDYVQTQPVIMLRLSVRCQLAVTHSDTAPLQSQRLGCQRVGLHQVVYVHPVHPGLGVPEPETEQPALHVHLGERQRRRQREKWGIWGESEEWRARLRHRLSKPLGRHQTQNLNTALPFRGAYTAASVTGRPGELH